MASLASLAARASAVVRGALDGRTQRRWTSHYRRIIVHRYRSLDLCRNVQGRLRRVRVKWVLYRRNHYY